jgi:hypothetical protein
MRRDITNRGVFSTGNVREKRAVAKCVVAESVSVITERRATDSIVEEATVVMDEGRSSNRGVVRATGVEQQRCGAQCGIGISRVEDQRSSANTGIEVGSGVQKERAPTNSRVSGIGREGIKSVAPFCCRESGITPVRRRVDRLRPGQKPEAGCRGQDCCEYDCGTFYDVILPFIVFGPSGILASSP